MKRLLCSMLAWAALAPLAEAQDGKAGEAKAAMCIGCHGIPGYQSSFPEVHKVPMISGQNAKYIAAALGAYKKGERKHPTMRAVAASLTDQDIADLAEFYQAHGTEADRPPAKLAAEPPPQVAEILKKAACASCHGENMNTPIDPSYPKIAGQYADYLYAAMKAYKTDNNALIGRNNAIMAGMVKPFSPAELKTLARYIGSLPGELETVRQSPFK